MPKNRGAVGAKTRSRRRKPRGGTPQPTRGLGEHCNLQAPWAWAGFGAEPRRKRVLMHWATLHPLRSPHFSSSSLPLPPFSCMFVPSRQPILSLFSLSCHETASKKSSYRCLRVHCKLSQRGPGRSPSRLPVRVSVTLEPRKRIW